MDDQEFPISAWFADPKAENSEWFSEIIDRILEDHQYWRRNYFPEDGVVLTSESRRRQGPWNDLFEDKLLELLAALKADFPFHSPRYAAHMVAEQTLASIAGYFAGMLYNPNNITKESAPVTVELELQAGDMIARMVGYDPDASWSHLTSGGTVANLEALWTARMVKYLPLTLRDVIDALDLNHFLADQSEDQLLAYPPEEALELLEEVFDAAEEAYGDTARTTRKVIAAYRASDYNVAQVGIHGIWAQLESRPILVVPETYHYCLSKIVDVLGIGRRGLRRVQVDEQFRMRPEHLRSTLEEIDRSDEHVLAVVTAVGTTEEGSIDPVHDILQIRREREADDRASFWLHADAAYGGYLRTMMMPHPMDMGAPTSTVEIDDREVTLDLNLPEDVLYSSLEPLGECDSLAVDPHKLGYIPYPAGAVCFKSDLVRPVLRQEAPYLEEPPSGPQEERTSEGIGMYILEGSKPGAAAAAVWLSHATIPLDIRGHGRLIRETIRSTCELYTLLEDWPDLREGSAVQAAPLCTPDSNILCYAFRPTDEPPSLEAVNHLNRALYERLSLSSDHRFRVYDQEFFVSRTTLSPDRYRRETIAGFLDCLDVSPDDYDENGVFLLRSTLMNPWYRKAKERGHYYLVDLVDELYEQADAIWQEADYATDSDSRTNSRST